MPGQAKHQREYEDKVVPHLVTFMRVYTPPFFDEDSTVMERRPRIVIYSGDFLRTQKRMVSRSIKRPIQ